MFLIFKSIIDNSTYEDGKYVIIRDNFKRSLIFQKDNNQMAANSNVITSEAFQITDGVLYVKLKCRNNFVFEKIALARIENAIAHGFMVYNKSGEILKEWYGQNPNQGVKTILTDRFNLIPNSVQMNFIK